MKRVKGFNLPLPDPGDCRVQINLPQYAQALTVSAEADELTVWVLTDSTANLRLRSFCVAATNQPLEEVNLARYRFLASVQAMGQMQHVWVEE